ncbi:MAG: response regulator [Pirellulaceae bacterium]
MTDLPTQPVFFLLVDDLEENLLALEALLRRDGLVLLQARSGRDALELLLRHDIALALVDVRMPDMDGFELAELMRGSERTRRVPIIFLTAGAPSLQRRFRGYEAGAVDFLQKPIEPDILRSKADVFFELYRQRQEVARQRDELKAVVSENARLLQESRQATAALREADRRKDEFLATLAHELRNPLAPILNAIQLLGVPDLAPAEADELRQMIERQVKHMVRLVDDLLDLSRITQSKIKLQRHRVAVSEIVQNAIETSRPLLSAGHHEVEVQIPDEPLIVLADTVRLTQVLANLLNNAAKFTPERGRICVAAERHGQEIALSVIDSGLGIPPDMLGKVFEMFTQVNQHLIGSQGGLGIGLSLVKGLVQLHGGTVEVYSEGEGRGARFTVRLPVAETATAAAPAPAKAAVAHAVHQRRILVIDDNQDAANSLALLLKMCGHTVATAHSGEAGLAQAIAFRPQVVLLDLGMPGMDGFETARRLRELDEARDSVLVALTGWGQDEDRRRTSAVGFERHLVKPVDLSGLQKLLASLGPGPR